MEKLLFRGSVDNVSMLDAVFEQDSNSTPELLLISSVPSSLLDEDGSALAPQMDCACSDTFCSIS